MKSQTQIISTLSMIKPLLALLGVLCFGTLGFMVIQDQWGFWKSFFFTLITITTVGYSDYQLSPAGEKFAIILLLFGIATATFAFKQLVTSVINHGSLRRYKMQRAIDKLSKHTVICGWGHLGRVVCERLIDAGKPFVVIEKDPDRFEEACFLGHLCIQGSATDDMVLLQAGIDRAECLACAVPVDMENIIITLSAKELNANLRIISRVDEEGGAPKMRRAGASFVVSPAQKGGDEIANMIVNPHLTKILAHTKQDYEGIAISEVCIEEGSDLSGKTLEDYGKAEPSLVFIATKNQISDMLLRPTSSTAIRPGDVVVVAGDAPAIQRMRFSATARESAIA